MQSLREGQLRRSRAEVRVVTIDLQAAAVGACATAPQLRVTQLFECPLRW